MHIEKVVLLKKNFPLLQKFPEFSLPFCIFPDTSLTTFELPDFSGFPDLPEKNGNCACAKTQQIFFRNKFHMNL